MTAERLECDCGHRLALHTYFKDRTPCTRCQCGSFITDTPVRRFRAKRSDATKRIESVLARTDAETRI